MIGFIIMAWTLWMALRPDPTITLDIYDGDKMMHAFTFCCLMGWWGNVFHARRARGLAALGCLAFGVLIEILQWLMPPRDADALDVLADAIGIMLGLLLLHTPLARALRRFEAWVCRTA